MSGDYARPSMTSEQRWINYNSYSTDFDLLNTMHIFVQIELLLVIILGNIPLHH
jgi:hypothetical protein